MSKIYSDSFKKSYGSYSYYNSNKNLNEYLRKKKTKKDLAENGFILVNMTVETAIKKIAASHNIWVFPPSMFKGYITQSGFKDKGLIYSHYGRILKKWKCHNGNVYLYKTRIPIFDEYYNVYVFTNSHRKIIKELWT